MIAAALTVVSTLLVVAGLGFLLTSVVGLYRLPDLYTRAHAVAVSETAGMIMIFGGLLLRPETDVAIAVRLVVIIVFSMIANPTGVHALARAAEHQGVEPWRRRSAGRKQRP